MSDFVMHYGGKDLLEFLSRDCDLSLEAAQEFLENKTGTRFDASATYGVSYPRTSGERDWRHTAGLTVWLAPSHDPEVSHSESKRSEEED